MRSQLSHVTVNRTHVSKSSAVTVQQCVEAIVVDDEKQLSEFRSGCVTLNFGTSSLITTPGTMITDITQLNVNIF